MRSHVGVAQTRQVEGVADHQHRHVQQEFPEDYQDIPQVDRGASRKENQGHHQVEEVEENRPEDVETGEFPWWALLTPLMLKLSVSHALSLTLLAFTNLLD